TGGCYDLSETPPYGPWIEIFDDCRQADGLPPLPTAFAQRGAVGEVPDPVALFAQVRDFFGAITVAHPLVLLLDDLHWADASSLDLFRFLARNAASMPLVLIATCRSDEIPRDHALYHLLPVLVRESAVIRLALRPLTTEDIQALVRAHFPLPDAD